MAEKRRLMLMEGMDEKESLVQNAIAERKRREAALIAGFKDMVKTRKADPSL